MKYAGVAMLALLVLFSGPVSAFGFFDIRTSAGGTVLPAPSAWALAHGGVRALPFSGTAGIFSNPASLPEDDEFDLDVSGSLVTWKTITEYSGFVTHDRTTTGRAAGPVTLSAGLGIGDLTFGAGVSRVSDLGIHGYVDVQDTTSLGLLYVDGVEEIDAIGGLWEVTAGVAGNPWEDLRIGVSVGSRFGDGRSDWRFYRSGESDPADSEEISWRERAFSAHAGLVASVGRATLAGSIDTGSDRYPWRFNGGAQIGLDFFNGSVLGLETGVSSLDGIEDKTVQAFLETGSLYSETGRSVYSVGMVQPGNYSRTGLCFSIGHRLQVGVDTVLDLCVLWTSRILAGSRLPVRFIDEDSSSSTYYSVGVTGLL